MPPIFDYGRADRRRPPRDTEIAAVTLGIIAIALLAFELGRRWNAVTAGITETLAVGGLVCSIAALARPPQHWPLLVLGLLLCAIAFFCETVLIILWLSDW